MEDSTTAAEAKATFILPVERAGSRYELTLPQGGNLGDLRAAVVAALSLDASARVHLFLETVEVVGGDEVALAQVGLESLGPLALTLMVDEGDCDASDSEAGSDDDADSVGSLVNFVVPDEDDEQVVQPVPGHRSAIVDLDPSNILEPGAKRRRVPPRRFVHPDLVAANEAVAAVLAAAAVNGDSDSEDDDEDDGEYAPDEEEEEEEEEDDDEDEEDASDEEEWTDSDSVVEESESEGSDDQAA